MLLILFMDILIYLIEFCTCLDIVILLSKLCGNYDVVLLLIFQWVKGVTIKIQNHK